MLICRLGDTPAGLLVPADRAYALGNAAEGDGLVLPAVKAKDPVRLRDDLPTFEVGDLPAALLPLADIGPIEGGGEECELLGTARAVARGKPGRHPNTGPGAEDGRRRPEPCGVCSAQVKPAYFGRTVLHAAPS